ncbi:MAG: GAF domain-containing protein [Calditrichaeota bacterium]|nr:GAF domain-containing protein [Calditrichota bacterium]
MIEKIPHTNGETNLSKDVLSSWDTILRITNLVHHGFFMIQAKNLRILQANAYSAKLTGYPVQELIGKSLESLHLSDEIPLIQLEIQRLEFEGKTEIEGIHVCQKNGFQIPVDIVFSRLPGTGEEGPIDYFLAVYREAVSGGWQDAYTRRNQELITLMEMGQTMASALDLEEIIDLSLIKIGTISHAVYASLFLKATDGNSELFRAQKIPPEEIVLFDQPWKVGLEEGPYRDVLDSKETLIVENVLEESRYERWQPIAQRIGYSATISIPLIPKDDAIGVLSLYYESPRQFLQDEINFLKTAGTYLAISIENSRLYKQYQQKTDQIAALNKIINSVNSSLDVEEVIRIIALEVQKIVDFDFISIMLFHDNTEHIQYFPLGTAPLAKRLGDKNWVPIENSNLGWINFWGESQEATDSGLEYGIHDRRSQIERELHSQIRALLMSKGKYIGTFSVGKLDKNAYSPAHKRLLKQIANQVSTAIENALLYQEVKRSMMEYSALVDVSNSLGLSLNSNVVVDSIVKAAAVAMGAKLSTIWFVGSSGSGRSVPENNVFDLMLKTPLAKKLKQMIVEKEPLSISDLHKEGFTPPEISDHPLSGNLKSYLGVPILSNGETIAILSVYWDQFHEIESREIRLLSAIASQATMALENARLFERERKRSAQLAMVNEVGKRIASTLNLNHLLDNVVRAIYEIFRYRNVSIYLSENAHERLVLKSQKGQLSDILKIGSENTETEGPIWKAYRSGHTVLINNLTRNERIDEGYPESGSLLSIPLKIAGRPMGVLALLAGDRNAFDERDVNAFEALSGQLSSAIQNSRLYEETRQNTEKLSRANEELEDFVFTVSHDLKAPIVSISGFTTILMTEYGDRIDEEGHHYLERIQGNVKQMENLIRDLLELSRIGRVVNPFERVAIADIVKTAIDDLLLQIKQKNVNVIVQEKMPEVVCDKARILQVFTNLISNAVKYIGNTPEPKIEIGFKELDESYQFYVKDNGIGIDPKYHKKIFELFHMLKELKSVEGTGVGLTIVRRIVENHRGRVWVESEKGKGSTFYFTLPKTQGEKTSD